MDLLKQLCTTPGVSGREQRVRQLITDTVRPFVDEIRTDPMGSLICLRKPRPTPPSKARQAATPTKPPLKVMLAGHMDQIGFMVRHIDNNGFVRITNLGGFDTRVLLARLVTVCTESGDLPGVMNPATKPIHVATEEEKKKIPEINDFAIDLGLPAATVKKKVKIGDMVALQAPCLDIGDTLTGQAMDNRVACWVIIRALQQLTHHDCVIYAVFTVQEEVGLRGAVTSAYGVKPDVGIGIDITLAVDTPGVAEDQRISIFNGGAAITVMDSSFIADAALVAEFEAVAKKKKIKHQLSILTRGGTDTAALQKAAAGCRALTLSCPTRYVHTVVEMVHKKDLAACRDLLAAYLEQAL